jgi:hypothetical protein
MDAARTYDDGLGTSTNRHSEQPGRWVARGTTSVGATNRTRRSLGSAPNIGSYRDVKGAANRLGSCG